MSIVLKSNVTKYEVSLDAVQDLIAKDLGVQKDLVSVRYVIEEVGGDPLDRYRGTDQVTRLEVTVTNPTNTRSY